MRKCTKCGREWGGNHIVCPEPSLQLLILDLGDSCVVKVEKGEMPLAGLVGIETEVYLYEHCFTDLRAALDGDKPVPRLEKGLPCDNPYTDIYQLIVPESDKMHTIYEYEYEALCQLAGKPLPIWTGSGEWTRLNTHDWTQAKRDAGEAGYGIDSFSFEEAICPVKIWRYTR